MVSLSDRIMNRYWEHHALSWMWKAPSKVDPDRTDSIIDLSQLFG